MAYVAEALFFAVVIVAVGVGPVPQRFQTVAVVLRRLQFAYGAQSMRAAPGGSTRGTSEINIA